MSNILFQKVPDKVGDVAKGIAYILIPIPFLFLFYFVIIFAGFRGDVQGPNYAPIANVAVGGIFSIFLVVGILKMFGSSVSKRLHRNILIIISALIVLAIIFLTY